MKINFNTIIVGLTATDGSGNVTWQAGFQYYYSRINSNYLYCLLSPMSNFNTIIVGLTGDVSPRN